MNRYIIDGVVNDLRDARFVVLTSHTLRDSASIFEAIAERALEDQLVTRLSRVNGGQRIETATGGKLIVTAANMRGGRGFDADTVVAYKPNSMTDRQVADLDDYAMVTGAELITT